MKINPIHILQWKRMMEQFETNHPRLMPFFQAAGEAVDAGTMINIEVVTSEGKELITNLLISESDMELIQQAKKYTQQ